MHPLLRNPRQLALYLLAWIPLVVILAHMQTGSTGLTWPEALALTVPTCLIYAFVCLSAWYPCKATPIEQSGFPRLVLTHLTAAVVLGSLWMLLAEFLAHGLSQHATFAGLEQRQAKYSGLFWVSGILLYVMSVTFHYVLLAEQTSREAQARALEARVLARDAELKALRAQVNPHFLFNCLHSISALTSADAAKAREMCILLADFLRATLRLGGQETVTLEEELALVRGYLAIEKVRFGARLQMQEQVSAEVLNVPIPPLLLQPLVENAIRHGIANLPEGGIIRLGAECNPQAVSILVENSFDPESPASLKTGLGLENIRQRLAARYGAEASISVHTDGSAFSVLLNLPGNENGAGK